MRLLKGGVVHRNVPRARRETQRHRAQILDLTWEEIDDVGRLWA